MYFAFSQEQEDFKASLRNLLVDQMPTSRVRESFQAGYDKGLWKVLTNEMAITGLHLPEALGGQGFTYQETALVMAELGRCLAPVPVLATNLAIEAIRACGTPEQQAALIPDLAGGERIGAVAVAATRDLEPATATVSATSTSDGPVLDGVVPLALHGHVADLLVVPAVDGGAVRLFVVEASAPGVAVTQLPSLDLTRPVSEVRLSAAPAHRLDGDGTTTALERFADGARLLIAFESLGAAERCLELAVEYARTRHQFNRPIGSFQAIKHLCSDMAIELDASLGAAMYAAMTADEDTDEFAAVAGLVKAQASEVFTQCASYVIQVHGGIGFTWEHDCHLYYRRAKANEVLLGDIDELRTRSIDGIPAFATA